MFLDITRILLEVAWWFIIVQAILSWLIAFNVINTSNPFVAQMWMTLDRLTEPLYRPFRRVIPDFGGLDLTPMAVLVLIMILQGPVLNYLYMLAARSGL
jgi:YggT family protein